MSSISSVGTATPIYRPTQASSSAKSAQTKAKEEAAESPAQEAAEHDGGLDVKG